MAKKNDTVLTIENAHTDQCGRPPALTNDPDKYTSYFENLYGEQFVLIWDFDLKSGKLYGGDFGWDSPANINIDGSMRINLSSPEQAWVTACMSIIQYRHAAIDSRKGP